MVLPVTYAITYRIRCRPIIRRLFLFCDKQNTFSTRSTPLATTYATPPSQSTHSSFYATHPRTRISWGVCTIHAIGSSVRRTPPDTHQLGSVYDTRHRLDTTLCTRPSITQHTITYNTVKKVVHTLLHVAVVVEIACYSQCDTIYLFINASPLKV